MHKLNIIITAIALILVIIAIAPHNQAPDIDTPDTKQENTSALHEKVESPNPEPTPDAVEKEEEKHEEVPLNPEKEKEPTEPVKEEKNTESLKKLIMIHNGKGSMCVNQLKFLEDLKPKYTSLIIEEHLTTEQGTTEILRELKANYTASEGISKTFGYLPITFINNHAYSGFSRKVKEKLQKDIQEICAS